MIINVEYVSFYRKLPFPDRLGFISNCSLGPGEQFYYSALWNNPSFSLFTFLFLFMTLSFSAVDFSSYLGYVFVRDSESRLEIDRYLEEDQKKGVFSTAEACSSLLKNEKKTIYRKAKHTTKRREFQTCIS